MVLIFDIMIPLSCSKKNAIARQIRTMTRARLAIRIYEICSCLPDSLLPRHYRAYTVADGFGADYVY